MLIVFIVLIFLPDTETVVEGVSIRSSNCLKRLQEVNLYLFFVFAVKWLMSAYRLRVYQRRKKDTAAQVLRLRNEIIRNLHGEQYGPNMVFVAALVFSSFTYFSIDSALTGQCPRISSKFRALKLWVNLCCYAGFLVIPVYLLLFCYARALKSNDERQGERDR